MNNETTFLIYSNTFKVFQGTTLNLYGINKAFNKIYGHSCGIIKWYCHSGP